jgi:hypothetical protein
MIRSCCSIVTGAVLLALLVVGSDARTGWFAALFELVAHHRSPPGMPFPVRLYQIPP